MRKRTRGYAAVIGLATLALVATACGGSSGTTSSGGSGSTVAGWQALNPGTGSPKSGGTLNMLGVGDVDYMDYNLSYYTLGGLIQRAYVRGLYSYPAISGSKSTQPAPDLATGPPVVSNGGKTYKITIRSGAMWDTSPPRQVTAADALLGLKRDCNPVQPFGGFTDFVALIDGYQSFCDGFAKAKPTVSGIKAYVNNHQISGVTASGETITYRLTHPASYFAAMLAMPSAFNPAPVESLNYIPGSAVSQQHVIADGPYKIQSYTPTRSIVLVRNPAWKASTDPIHKAYVNEIKVSETGNQDSIQQQLQTNTAAASMEFDSFPPVGATPGLVNQMKQGLNNNFNLGPSYSTNPYFVFNQLSPNNGKALSKVAVRQALSYGINRSHLVSDAGGPTLSPPLTHVLPPGINGAQDVPSGYNPYPYNPTKAKQMLAAAGVKNMTLTLLYRPSSSISAKMGQTLQADLGKIGVKVKLLSATPADFYVKYLQVPTVAKRGVWDVALAGWGPDWFGDGAASFFNPLFSGPRSYQPQGNNDGFYNNPSVTTMIDRASSTQSPTAAATIWAQADVAVMKDAPIYPITDPQQPLYHASYVHNAVYIPGDQGFDPTNVWLSSPG